MTPIFLWAIRFIAGYILVLAGLIHTFPFFWKKWDETMGDKPQLHHVIGGVGLFFGFLSIFIAFHEFLSFRKRIHEKNL